MVSVASLLIKTPKKTTCCVLPKRLLLCSDMYPQRDLNFHTVESLSKAENIVSSCSLLSSLLRATESFGSRNADFSQSAGMMEKKAKTCMFLEFILFPSCWFGTRLAHLDQIN